MNIEVNGKLIILMGRLIAGRIIAYCLNEQDAYYMYKMHQTEIQLFSYLMFIIIIIYLSNRKHIFG